MPILWKITRPRADARLLAGPEVLDAPQAAVSDDSDGWWSGSALNFVAIPLAGAVAAVALSASLSLGYNTQNEEDVAPQVAAEVSTVGATLPVQSETYLVQPWYDEAAFPIVVAPGEEDGWRPPVFLAEYRVDLIQISQAGPPPVAALSVEDEGSWPVPVFLSDGRLALQWTSHGQTDPVAAAGTAPPDEAYQWTPPPPEGFVEVSVWLHDDDPPVILSEDYWQQPPVVAQRPAAPAWTAPDDLPIAATPQGPTSGTGGATLPLQAPYYILTPWVADEEIVPLAAAVQVTEDYWWSVKPLTSTTAQPATDDEILPGARAFTGDDYWWRAVWIPAPLYGQPLSDDEILPGGRAFTGDDYWFPLTWIVPPLAKQPATDTEILPGAGAITDTDYWWRPPPPLPVAFAPLYTYDEFLPGASAVPIGGYVFIVDNRGQVFTVPASRARVTAPPRSRIFIVPERTEDT